MVFSQFYYPCPFCVNSDLFLLRCSPPLETIITKTQETTLSKWGLNIRTAVFSLQTS